MKTYRSTFYYLLGLILLFGTFLAPSVTHAANSFVGDSVDAGRLRFGIGFGQRPTSNVEEDRIRNTPTVQYVQSESNVIDHLYTNKNNGSGTTSPFNIIEELSEYQSAGYDATAGKITLPTGGIKKGDRIIVSEGKKIGSNDFLVNITMEADKKNTSVLHTYSITNTSKVTKTIYPIKQVDTELAMNDDVPIFSRGPNKGLYIESEDESDQNVYRLDYITDVDNGPIAYSGKGQYETLDTVFGPDMANPVAEVNGQSINELEEDEIVFENDDTGIFMAWGERTIAPGETIDLAYAVGISAATKMKIDKTVDNTSSKDGLNRTGDVLTYTVNLNNSADEGAGLAEKIEISDILPKEVEKPTKIALTDSKGVTTDLAIEDVYDAATHSIKTKTADMLGQDKVVLTYQVKVKSDAAGKTLINAAKATGQNPNGGLFEIEASTETPILNLSKITINYQDEKGLELAKSKVIEGTIGESYDEQPKVIFGYNNISVTGNPSGQFTETDESVTFVYSAKEMFTLNQEVLNSAGMNMDQQDVGLDEVLTYKVTIDPNSQEFTEDEAASNYKQIELSELIDPNLTDVTKAKLMTESGTEIGTATYDANKHLVTGKITESDNVNLLEKIILSYEATVHSETPIGTIIKEKAEANVSYTDSSTLNIKKLSNEVAVTVNRGELIFESAPKVLNFGIDNKISSKDKLIELVSKDHDLSVRDLRGKGSQWSMTVKLLDEMTNSGSSLADSLRYVKDGTEQIISKDASAIVYQKTTESNEIVNISNQWSSKNKPVLKVKAGLARVGNYEGTIQWALQDVPIFEE
jgi:uncharacterized repeat protein (TIGR01451 family)